MRMQMIYRLLAGCTAVLTAAGGEFFLNPGVTGVQDWNSAIWGDPAAIPVAGSSYVADRAGVQLKINEGGSRFAGDVLRLNTNAVAYSKGSGSVGRLELNGGRWETRAPASLLTVSGAVHLAASSRLLLYDSSLTLTAALSAESGAVLTVANMGAAGRALAVNSPDAGFCGTFRIEDSSRAVPLQVSFGADYPAATLLLAGNAGGSQAAVYRLEGHRLFGRILLPDGSGRLVDLPAGTYSAAGLMAAGVSPERIADLGGWLTVCDVEYRFLGRRTPFWRNAGAVSPNSAEGWRLTSIPGDLTEASLSFPVITRPYSREVPQADQMIFIRLLGGLSDTNGNPLLEEDFAYRRPDGGLAFRTNLITARLQNYLDAGYTDLTVVLDNVCWCLPAAPQNGAYGQRSPPADPEEWYEVLQELCRHLVFLLGDERAGRLRFRVGTEIDWTQRWAGTGEEFIRHYDYSAAAVRSILPQARIGAFNKLGGATFNGSWGNVSYAALAEHCRIGMNAKTGQPGTPFEWANASFYFTDVNQDADRMSASLERFFQSVESIHSGLAREVHEFGLLRDAAGLDSMEAGSRGAALVFNALVNFERMGMDVCTSWWRGDLEPMSSSGGAPNLMAGQRWTMNMLQHFYEHGELALLPVKGWSPAGTRWKAIASKGRSGRLLLAVSSVNTDPMVSAAETVQVIIPSSFVSLSAAPEVRWIRYDRDQAIYEIVRKDLLTQGLLDDAFKHPHRPVSQLWQMCGMAGKNFVANNWISGRNYRALQQANLTLAAAQGVVVRGGGSAEQTVELTLTPDSVTVLEFTSGYSRWADGFSSPIGTELEDADGDGCANLCEYAFRGDPLDRTNTGDQLIFSARDGRLDLMYARRADDGSLWYSIEGTRDLISGVWSNITAQVTASNRLDAVFSRITCTLPLDEDHCCYRLRAGRQ